MLSVCIVEDTKSISKRVSARLDAMSNVSVLTTYENAEDALEGLLRLRPQLTIMDIGLPKMSGTELLARLVDKGFDGDVIMFTVFDHDEHLFRALELGAIGYVLKEDRASGVQHAVEVYVKGGAPMSPSIAKRVLQTFSRPKTVGLSAKLETLTEQQLKIIRLLAEGLVNKEIADRLELTEGSIKQHIHRIYRKLCVNNRAEAVKLYLTRK